MKKKLGTVLISLIAGAAIAQAPLGTVTNVSGVATVTTGTAGTAITVGAPIVEGARVITTTTGSVTFRLANGCVITVPPGHAITVRSAMSCQQLQAAMQPVTTAVTTTTATTSGTVPAGVGIGTPSGAAVAGFAALLAVGAIAANNDDNNNTPISGR
ncbi:hypothetical protein H8N03_10840 [Ramlibacter sp. USB13]|uniref:Uncharacterized protein n=1 Tax=Ramlibacter cellulosilyticus TaxID=2764187 RepID=A0A923MTC6_9BURK|nr:hypothetical protein [Ramlibacter cellulosilyticus]MBC5783442.1 hypothetical protein [Ramlibacter cellulosilyticus]